MKSILEKIYLGTCMNFANIKPSEEYWKIYDVENKYFEDLKSILSEKQREMLDELDAKMGELSAEHSMTNFIEGFKFGMKLATEVFLVD